MGRHGIVCVIDDERREINAATHNCGDQSHRHITRAKAAILEKDGAVEWIKKPANRKEKGIVRVLKLKVSMRGMSCKVGATLTRALTEKKIWAGVMVAEIQRRPLAPSGGL